MPQIYLAMHVFKVHITNETGQVLHSCFLLIPTEQPGKKQYLFINILQLSPHTSPIMHNALRHCIYLAVTFLAHPLFPVLCWLQLIKHRPEIFSGDPGQLPHQSFKKRKEEENPRPSSPASVKEEHRKEDGSCEHTGLWTP